MKKHLIEEKIKEQYKNLYNLKIIWNKLEDLEYITLKWENGYSTFFNPTTKENFNIPIYCTKNINPLEVYYDKKEEWKLIYHTKRKEYYVEYFQKNKEIIIEKRRQYFKDYYKKNKK